MSIASLKVQLRVALHFPVREIRIEAPLKGLTMEEICFYIAKWNQLYPDREYYIKGNAIVSSPREEYA